MWDVDDRNRGNESDENIAVVIEDNNHDEELEETLKVGGWFRAAWQRFARFYLGTVARLTK